MFVLWHRAAHGNRDFTATVIAHDREFDLVEDPAPQLPAFDDHDAVTTVVGSDLLRQFGGEARARHAERGHA
ncbi:MAG: hypothetical protein E6Q88_00365 [Lysobacteraceae bacterium]|nr:MAG: hypothetical protein E6Q88_00365 [Xanthomonadaceae bacterium]